MFWSLISQTCSKLLAVNPIKMWIKYRVSLFCVEGWENKKFSVCDRQERPWRTAACWRQTAKMETVWSLWQQPWSPWIFTMLCWDHQVGICPCMAVKTQYIQGGGNISQYNNPAANNSLVKLTMFCECRKCRVNLWCSVFFDFCLWCFFCGNHCYSWTVQFSGVCLSCQDFAMVSFRFSNSEPTIQAAAFRPVCTITVVC